MRIFNYTNKTIVYVDNETNEFIPSRLTVVTFDPEFNLDRFRSDMLKDLTMVNPAANMNVSETLENINSPYVQRMNEFGECCPISFADMTLDEFAQHITIVTNFISNVHIEVFNIDRPASYM